MLLCKTEDLVGRSWCDRICLSYTQCLWKTVYTWRTKIKVNISSVGYLKYRWTLKISNISNVIISWSKRFFPRKIGNHKIFTGEEYMRLEFIYWARHKWQKVDSFFWICRFSSKLSYHSYQQRVCKSMFLTKTFVKQIIIKCVALSY